LKSDKILILSQFFYPDIASTGQLLTELALGLSKQGIEVNVLTGYPTYGKGIHAYKKEKLEDISIKRVWSTRLNKNTMKGQIFNSLTFFTTCFFSLLFSFDKSPILIVSNPPFLPVLGALMHTLKGRKFIYLVHDVFPDKAIKLEYIKENSFLCKLWKWADRYILRTTSEVIALSCSMQRVMQEKYKKYGLKPHHVTIIHNWADDNFIKPIDKKDNPFIKENNLQDKFIVQYSGNLGASYELEFIIDTARMIKDEDIVFLFIGDGVKKGKLQAMVKEYSLKNVVFMPYQKKENLPYSLTASCVSLVTYDHNLDGLLMPSKLYSILASGKPVIAFCKKDSEVGHIVREAECGYLIEDNYAAEFAEKIILLKNNEALRLALGKNARLYFERYFTFKHSLKQYIETIENLQS
jgi:glycosyltransferase involved in cell wall biosynthesis